jgi:RecB family endonuclease NucS
LPNDFEPNRTSHELRRELHQLGWSLRIMENDVFIVKPVTGSYDYAQDLLQEYKNETPSLESKQNELFEITARIERSLQSSLRKAISKLEEGLSIIDNGTERKTKVGTIDITAQDHLNKKVIITINAFDAKNDGIANTLALMEAIKNTDTCEVRGIIVASGFSQKLVLAAKQISNLKLVDYNYQFNFNEAD